MIKVYCNDINNAFTNCQPLTAIYTYGELVWPMGPFPPGVWYVSWAPSDISGSFSMFSTWYRYESYSGLYSWEGSDSGIITSNAFVGNRGGSKMTYMETNVLSISEYGFERCYSLSEASMSRVLYIGDGVFSNCSSLESIYAPRVRTIGYAAFKNCSSLSSYLYLSVVESIDYVAFTGCTNLTAISLPECRVIGTSAFSGCPLTSVSLPKCEVLSADAFSGALFTSIDLPVCSYIGGLGTCQNLVSISAPACTSFGNLKNCPKVESLDLPECINMGIVSGCPSLRTVSLPKCKWIKTNAFKSCYSLSDVYLGDCSNISGSAFSDCSNLTLLTLSGSSVCKLFENNPSKVFYNTPLLNCSGSIYVPLRLYGEYKKNTGWSYLTCILQSTSEEPGSYYIRWTPSNISETFISFRLEGYTYYTEDFSSGYFAWFDGVITDHAFEYTPIQTIETNAYGIDQGAFTRVPLTTVSLSACEYIGLTAFMNCYSLTSVYIPKCISIGEDAFCACSSLTSIDLPSCEYLGEYAFERCVTLSSISLPKCRYISSGAFLYCSSLTSIDLPSCEYLGDGAFGLNSITITLGGSSVCELDHYLTLSYYTDFTGSIYVPASLLSEYKSASYWSNYKSCIYPIP